MDVDRFLLNIETAFEAYQRYNTSGQEFRQHGKVPYANHAIWQATMILHDTKLPWEVRETGFEVLLYHDVREDTSMPLPEWLSAEVVRCVKEMTFDSFAASLPELPKKEPKIKLFILIDKLATFIEENMVADSKKRRLWKEAVEYLTTEVRTYYGRTQVVIIAEAMLANSDW
jgi:hypothetical protein